MGFGGCACFWFSWLACLLRHSSFSSLKLHLATLPQWNHCDDIAHRQFAEGHNLFFLAVIGLIPFAILTVLVRGLSSTLTRMHFCLFSLCGLVGILALMIPAHVSVWRPLYTDEHASSTAVIAFLFIPFFCTVSMGIGIGVASLVSIPHWIQRRKGKETLTIR